MESKLQAIILKVVRHNELDHLRLILETCSDELDQSEPGTSRTPKRPANRLNPIMLKKVTAIRDRKSRNLLHIVAKHGNVDMLNYLLEIGFPVDELDRDGNNVVHLLLNHANKKDKKKRKKNKKKNRKSGHKDDDRFEQLGYVQCCKLLEQILGRTNRSLLSMPNNDGIRSTDLLQTLWSQSSDKDRRHGDQILTRSVAQTSARTSYCEPSTSAERFQDESEFFRHSDLFDYDDDYDDPVESNYGNSWEDYFSGFRDQIFKSHLDTIREEYNRFRASTSAYSVPTPSTSRPDSATARQKPQPDPDAQDPDRQRREFHKRHAQALAKKTNQSVAIQDPVTFEIYVQRWSRFVEHESQPIRSLNDIQWLPFLGQDNANRDQADMIDRILSFVDHSASKLRQLQIQWHPDRFLSRFGSRFEDEQIKARASGQVVGISQLLNAAADKLREYQRYADKS